MYFHAITTTALLLLSSLHTTLASPAASPHQGKDALSYIEGQANMLYRRASGRKCDMSKASVPDAPTPLPPPSEGLSVSQVVLGRGTQNYTCASATSADKPEAIGAVATLYNVSCIAADFPFLLDVMTRISVNYPLPSTERGIARSNKHVGGNHFFRESTPIFDLNTAARELGVVAVAKVDATPAPEKAVPGQYGAGYGAVSWLKLEAASDTDENDWQEVYRVRTAGGQPPATCEGQPAELQIEYSAQYWFYD